MPEESLRYPAGPSVVDWLLADVGRVTRVISSLVLQRYYVDLIFSPAGNISGGAVEFEQATNNELYTSRDAQRVEPGRTFPVVGFDRGAVLTAQVEKFGAKFPVTDEARRRNRVGRVTRAMVQLANTLQRKIQQRALLELSAAIASFSRTSVGTSWATASTTTTANRLATVGPVADVTSVVVANEVAELGYVYNMAIMNPTEWRNGTLAMGGDDNFRAALGASGITQIWVTNRQPVGTIKWLAGRQVGELGYEVPLTPETWRDPEGRQQSWYQFSVLPIVYVTDPFAVLETTGH